MRWHISRDSIVARTSVFIAGFMLAACHSGPPGGGVGYSRPQPELTGLPYASQSFPTLATILDTNGDGGISPQELEIYLSQRFAFMDADGNGTVTREEFRSTEERDKTLQRQKQEYLDRTFGRLDSDNDAQLTKNELITGAAQRFKRADADGDGRITAEDAALSNGPPQQGMRGGRGRGMGGPQWQGGL